MDESRMVGTANEFEDVEGRVRVRSQGIPQIGIKIRQPGAVDNYVEVFLQSARQVGFDNEPWLCDIAFHNFELLPQKIREAISVFFKQGIEDRRILHHFFETPFRRIRLLPPNKKVDSLHVRQFHQRIGQPDLAYKSGDANQHRVLPRKRATNGKIALLPPAIKMYYGALGQ